MYDAPRNSVGCHPGTFPQPSSLYYLVNSKLDKLCGCFGAVWSFLVLVAKCAFPKLLETVLTLLPFFPSEAFPSNFFPACFFLVSSKSVQDVSLDTGGEHSDPFSPCFFITVPFYHRKPANLSLLDLNSSRGHTGNRYLDRTGTFVSQGGLYCRSELILLLQYTEFNDLLNAALVIQSLDWKCGNTAAVDGLLSLAVLRARPLQTHR